MLILLFLLGVGLLNIPDGVRCGSHHETTSYVDTLLRVSLPPKLQDGRLDPYTMPDFDVQSKSDHRITVQGKFRQGWLRGLSQVHRMGQCGPPALSPGGNTTFNCTLGFNVLNSTYPHTEIKYGVLPHSTSAVKANLTGCFGVIEVTSNSRGNSPSLSRFTVATLGQVQTGITGGVLKGEFPHLRTEFVHRYINDVQQAMFGPFTEALARAVAGAPLPSGLIS